MSAVKVDRNELVSALSLVQPGLSKRAFIEQSSCFVFDEGWVVTFNDEVCVRARSPLPPDFRGAVQAKPLTDVLSNLTDQQISVKIEDKFLSIRAGGKTVELRLDREIVLPVDEVSLPERWVALPDNFKDAVDRVTPAASSSDEEFLPQCVHLSPSFVEATDRRQVARYDIDLPVSESFVVRAKSLAPVAALEVVKMGETKEWVHFRNKSLVYSCRRHLEEFFKLDKAVQVSGERAELPTGDGEQAAKIASVFCDGKDNDKVTVDLKPGKMIVRGEGTLGRASIPLDMVYDGDDAQFALLPGMLVQLLKGPKECEFSEGKRMIVRGDNWVYVTGLGKPKAKATKEPVAAASDEE